MGDHVVGEVGILLAHERSVIGERGHEFQGVLSGRLSQILVLNNGDAELDEAVEQRLEHLGRDFSKIDERDEGLGEELCIARVLNGWQNVENLSDERVVLGLGLLGDGAKEGREGFNRRVSSAATPGGAPCASTSPATP